MKTIRDMTTRTFEALMFDLPLSPAARVDFGVASDRHYIALQRGVRSGRITLEALDAALGNGKVLTELCGKDGATFTTPYDRM